MYMKPILPAGGVLCPAMACMNSMELESMHMGSGPGVVGLSGMQVKPFVPLRTVRMLPSGFITTMVACELTFEGAAAAALLMMSASCILEAVAEAVVDVDAGVDAEVGVDSAL